MGETDTEHRVMSNLNADMDTLVLPISQVFLTDGGIETGGGGFRSTKTSQLYKGTWPPIDILPHELLQAVFELHVNLDTPVRSLVTLILVCKLWRSIVKGTPSLWCRISGREELHSIRKALTMAKNCLLEIDYWQMTAKASSRDFFAQIDDRVAQVKSLNVATNNFPRLPAILKTTSATKLESLRLLVRRGNRSAVTLFGGKPAPPALKNFHVAHLPVALAPLRLSGLRSLVLNNLPIASAEDLLRILMDSPALNVCSLNRLAFSTTFTPLEHLQRQPRGESNIAGANPRAIRLLHLRHLTLRELPVSFTHYLLSNIQASTFLSFSVQGELHESPSSELLTANTSHLVPLLKDSMANAETIEVGLLGDRSWAVGVGKLDIEFGGVRVEPRHVEETLNWV